MKVRLAKAARAEFRSAVGYLRARSPSAAQRLRSRLQAAIDSLAELSGRGRRSSINGARELLLRGAPYVVVYRLDADQITVIRIRHTRQDPSP